MFHLDCIQRWLKTRSACPLCNKEWEFAKIEKILPGARCLQGPRRTATSKCSHAVHTMPQSLPVGRQAVKLNLVVLVQAERWASLAAANEHGCGGPACQAPHVRQRHLERHSWASSVHLVAMDSSARIQEHPGSNVQLS